MSQSSCCAQAGLVENEGIIRHGGGYEFPIFFVLHPGILEIFKCQLVLFYRLTNKQRFLVIIEYRNSISQKFREIDFTKKAHGLHFGGINPITENEDNNHALWDIFFKSFDEFSQIL